MKPVHTPILIAVFAAFLSFGASAQNYQSIFDSVPENTSWDLIVWGACDAQCSDSFPVSSDTIINGLTYWNQGTLGFLREDTVAGKTWFYDPQYAEEYLAMDLSLSVGDSFPMIDYLNNSYPTVVDSVQVINGKKHLWLHVSIQQCGELATLAFIEGSGPNAGFHYQRNFAPGDQWTPGRVDSYLLCQHKGDVQTYAETVFDTCYTCYVGLPELAAATLQLYPSPADEQLSVTCSVPFTAATIRIVDLSGKTVRVLSGWEPAQGTIDLSALQPGMYTLLFETADAIAAGRFVRK